jgi:hypothetical protein
MVMFDACMRGALLQEATQQVHANMQPSHHMHAVAAPYTLA